MMPDVLTLQEAAEYLRLSERTTYSLARARRLPAAQIGGKWLFPRRQLQAWLAAEAEAPGTGRPAPGPTPPPILAGSHDPLLDWAVRQSGSGLAIRAGGSLDGLQALAEGAAMAAAIHVPDPDKEGFNESAVREMLPGRPMVGITWAWRRQGLLVAPGNPLGLAGVADLTRPGLRVIGRQNRAGSHVLLVHLLAEAGVRLDRVPFLPEPALAEDEVAAAVASGRADAGFGIEAEAATRGLGFVPLARERFDLAMERRFYFAAPMQALLRFTRTPLFRERAGRMAGHEVGECGEVAFNL